MTDAPRRFQLQSSYQPAGDQPEAIARLIDGLQNGLAHQTLLGVTGSEKALATTIRSTSSAARGVRKLRKSSGQVPSSMR